MVAAKDNVVRKIAFLEYNKKGRHGGRPSKVNLENP